MNYIKFLRDKEINKIVNNVRGMIKSALDVDEEGYEQELDFLAEDIVLALLYDEEEELFLDNVIDPWGVIWGTVRAHTILYEFYHSIEDAYISAQNLETEEGKANRLYYEELMTTLWGKLTTKGSDFTDELAVLRDHGWKFDTQE